MKGSTTAGNTSIRDSSTGATPSTAAEISGIGTESSKLNQQKTGKDTKNSVMIHENEEKSKGMEKEIPPIPRPPPPPPPDTLVLPGLEDIYDPSFENEEAESLSDFSFTATIETSEKYIEPTPIELAKQHRLDFDLKIPKFILKKRYVKQLYSVFDLIDTRHTGFIGIRGVTMVYRALGFEPERMEAREAIAKVDKRGKGRISFKEFLKLIKNKLGQREEEAGLRRGFKSMCFRRRRYITFKDFKFAAKVLGEKFEREECREIFREADKDHDGVINFTDFQKTINKINIFI